MIMERKGEYEWFLNSPFPHKLSLITPPEMPGPEILPSDL